MEGSCYLPQWFVFPNERHTHSLFFNALNSSIAGPLPNLYEVNPPPANNPKLLLTKLYILSWLSWVQRATQLDHALLVPSHGGYISLSSTILRHDVSPLFHTLPEWWISSSSLLIPVLSLGKSCLCLLCPVILCGHLYLPIRISWDQGTSVS